MPLLRHQYPEQKRRQIKLALTVVVALLLIGGGAWAYHKVNNIFSPETATTDSISHEPKLDKTAPVKPQIIQKDYKEKVEEMLDSDKSVGEISNETGLSKKEIRRIKKEKAQKEKDKAAGK